jgi:hypothetical protein
MDTATQAEIVLRGAGYDTWSWTGSSPAVTCFESAAVIGFLHVFPSATDLLTRWEAAQQTVLSRHAPALKVAGAKAWNVYSIFLTPDESIDGRRAIERIEENFSLTRKIARGAIQTADDVERALLPLTAVRAQPLLADADFQARLRSRLKDVPPEALTAFLGDVTAEEVARILGAMP